MLRSAPILTSKVIYFVVLRRAFGRVTCKYNTGFVIVYPLSTANFDPLWQQAGTTNLHS